MLIKRIFVLLSISMLVTAGGCRYSTKPMLPSDMKTIYIENFRNKIDILNERSSRKDYNVYRPKLEIGVTNAIVGEFLSDGTLKVVHREHADAILRGDVIEYKKQPLRYSEDEDIELYRVNIKVRIYLYDVKEEKTLLETQVVGDSNQFTVGRFASSEEQAIENALEDLARRVVEVTVEYGW